MICEYISKYTANLNLSLDYPYNTLFLCLMLLLVVEGYDSKVLHEALMST
jgi:hypothetical protein